jgi:type I restriction enzyme S subunit
MWDTVSAFRSVSEKPDQAQLAQTTDEFWEAWSYVSSSFDELLQSPNHIASVRATIHELAWRGALLSRGEPSAPASIEAISTNIVDCPHSTPRWTTDGIPCLRTNNFRVSGLDLTEVRRVSPETYKERVARLTPRAGDVVYSREGGILGIACVIPPTLTRVCLGQRMMLIRPDAKKCIPEFVSLMLNSPRINAQVRSLTGGTASPHLNVGDVRKFEIPLPELNDQQALLRAAGSLLSRCDELERKLSSRDTTVVTLAEALVEVIASGGRTGRAR